MAHKLNDSKLLATTSLRKTKGLDVKSKNLIEKKFEQWEEVIDPAGGDQNIFDSCAREISSLIHELALRL